MKMKKATPIGALLRKDIFRYAPLWGIYMIGGLLVMLNALPSVTTGRAAMELASTLGPFSILNMIYAALVAQMLFGDLYNTRMCYALHSLPMRRDAWFGIHVFSGLLYSFVPHVIATVCFLPLVQPFGVVAWAWLLAMVMEYLFFFGLAVACALCCGNRFAALAVYAIVNFVSLIVYWFVDTLYAPFLPGIVIPDALFVLFCPVLQMSRFGDLLKMEGEWIDKGYEASEYVVTYDGFGAGWGYLAICAVVGIGLLGVALLLYRRRQLESAGDFIAVSVLEPVFAVVFTLCVGCTFTLLGDVFSNGGGLLFFIVGLAIGWFSALMLTQRTVKVFKGKAFLRFLALLVALGLTIGMTAWDPLGLTTYVPDAQKVERVEVKFGSLSSGSAVIEMDFYYYGDRGITATDAETIEAVRQFHQQVLKDTDRHEGSRRFSLRYTLKSGRQVVRTYTVYRGTNSWNMLAALFSSPERILGASTQQEWLTTVGELRLNGYTMEEIVDKYNLVYRDDPDAEQFSAEKLQTSFLEAIWADCVMGTMNSEFMEDKYSGYDISVQCQGPSGMVYRGWILTENMLNCQQWLQDNKVVLAPIS